MFIKLLYKHVLSLVVRFSALVRLLALCLFIDISFFSVKEYVSKAYTLKSLQTGGMIRLTEDLFFFSLPT